MTDLPAGRELDALVAEKVMGMELLIHTATTLLGKPIYANLPAFSTDMAAAALILDKASYYEASGGNARTHRWYLEMGDQFGEAEADTAPLAICLAALKAVTLPA